MLFIWAHPLPAVEHHSPWKFLLAGCGSGFAGVRYRSRAPFRSKQLHGYFVRCGTAFPFSTHQAPPIPCAFPALWLLSLSKDYLRNKASPWLHPKGNGRKDDRTKNTRKYHQSHPRQGVPCLAEALVLCLAVLPSLSLRNGHGSYLTATVAPLSLLRIAIPNPAGIVGALHIVFIPSAAQGLLLPFAASVATRAFSPPQSMLSQLHRECPALRDLTTTFRFDGQTMAPCLRRRLLAPLQSVVRSPNRTSLTIAKRLHERKSSLRRQSVAPSLTHKTPVPLTFAA